MGCCVFHAEKTPSFHVSDHRQTFKCFGCGQQGDIFDFLILTKGLTFQQAVEHLAGPEAVNITRDPCHHAVERLEMVRDDNTRRIAHAHGIWLKREPIVGTVAERYLRQTRGIKGPLPGILGYSRSAYCSVLGEETEALIAPLQDGNGHVTAVQQIFLSRETDDAWRGADGKRVKRTLGAMSDGCVRLGVPDTVLGLAGSVEDALAASCLYSLPVWATCGEQRMARIWIPPEIERVVIFADADEAGAKAARDAQVAHRAKGLGITVMMPGGTKDWCEEAEKRAG